MVWQLKISSCNHNIFSSKLLWLLQQQRRSDSFWRQHIEHPTIRWKSTSIFTTKLYGLIFMVDAFCDVKSDWIGIFFAKAQRKNWWEWRSSDRTDGPEKRGGGTTAETETLVQPEYGADKFRWKLSWLKAFRDRPIYRGKDKIFRGKEKNWRPKWAATFNINLKQKKKNVFTIFPINSHFLIILILN